MTDLFGQSLAGHELHDDEEHASGLFEAVNGGDVGMVEGRQQACLAFEARQAFGVGRKKFGQDLDGDVSSQVRITRAIHLAHPARTERRDDLVCTEPLSSFQNHHIINRGADCS